MVPFAMSSLVASVLVWACTLHLVSASTFDGLPRSKGFPDAPTKAYGKFPPAYISVNMSADCDWYGFANVNYAVNITERCLAHTFQTRVLAEANTLNLPPYKYLSCSSNVLYDVCYDYYCKVGCFYLGNSSLTIPPITKLPSTYPSSGSSGGDDDFVPLTSRGDHAFLLLPLSVVMVAALYAGALAIQW